jgi:pilus assembly protein CpaE
MKSIPSTLVLVSPADTQPEERLKALGRDYAIVPITALQQFTQPGSEAPTILLVDVREHHDALVHLRAIRQLHPQAGLVIIAPLDPTLMLEAMRAGITECVPPPIDAEQLDAALTRVSATSTPATPGELFAVVGAKGGVGATTLAVNIATTLSAIDKRRALLIDLHPAGGDAALFLGAEPKFSFTDALDNTHRLDEAFLAGLVVKTGAGPDLLASPDRAVVAPFEPRRVRAVVELAMRCYRFVVLDVLRSDPSADETLGLASRIIVVATQELAAIRRASRTAAALRDRYGADQVQIVVNRYDRDAEIPSEELERAVGGPISHRIPSNYRVAIAALNKGRPLVTDNHNKLAAAFAAYGRALSSVARQKDRDHGARSGRLFSLLTGRR